MWRLVLGLVVLTALVEGRRHGLGEPHLAKDTPLPPDEWFTQTLDHFDPTNMKTWQQRYFTNATFFKISADAPVFLMIGGEGEASPKWMMTGAWLEYAEKYGALCFQLEHRFYGKSRPTPDMSIASLRYLSSEQALADLATFIEGMKSKYNLGPRNKWVVFGGSYPGCLAAWVRARYPHLVHAAMSASGPLLAKADFKEYFEVVRDSLTSYNDECPVFLKQGIKQAEAMIKRPLGMKLFTKKFRLCDTLDANKQLDVWTLFENLSEMVADVVQYNKDNRFTKGPFSNITIEDVCGVLSNMSIGDPIDRLAALNNWKLDLMNQTCQDFKYKNMVSEMREESWGSEDSEGGRQWFYQTCTEFGFYQTSTAYTDLFGGNMPLNYFLQQCSDIFGENFNKTLLENGIQRTNTVYGGLETKANRVIYVHGTIDPWHALGITQTRRQDAPAVLIEGTAHCANMYPSSPNDPPQLKAARDKISKHIGRWLMRN